jgi:hypothetical protein
MEAMLEMQREIFAVCEQANRCWLDRLKLEMGLASELNAKIAASKSMPEVASVYQEWMGRHMKQFVADGEKPMSNGQKLANAWMRIFTNGTSGGST